MMASVHVRRLDDEVVARLKERAAANNRSLEGEVRHILQQAVDEQASAVSIGGQEAGAAPEDMAEKRRRFFENINKIHAEIDWSNRPPQTPSEIIIREERDRRAGLIE